MEDHIFKLAAAGNIDILSADSFNCKVFDLDILALIIIIVSNEIGKSHGDGAHCSFIAFETTTFGNRSNLAKTAKNFSINGNGPRESLALLQAMTGFVVEDGSCSVFEECIILIGIGNDNTAKITFKGNITSNLRLELCNSSKVDGSCGLEGGGDGDILCRHAESVVHHRGGISTGFILDAPCIEHIAVSGSGGEGHIGSGLDRALRLCIDSTIDCVRVDGKGVGSYLSVLLVDRYKSTCSTIRAIAGE